MAAHKNFIITYIFPQGDSVQIPVKAPKQPTDKMIARAVAKANLALPTGTGDGFAMREWVAELGSGKQPVTKVVWCERGGKSEDTLLYSYVITETF